MQYVRLFHILLFMLIIWNIPVTGQDTIVLPADTVTSADITEEMDDHQDTVLTRKIGRSLYDLIRKEQGEEGKNQKMADGTEHFVTFENLTISSVRIVRLDPFGPTIREPDKKAVSFFDKTANKIHFRTHQSIIENSLLFDVGDELSPYTIADNERLLRNFPFIEDARIIVSHVSDSLEEVEIIVLTKDVFPYGFSAAAGSAEKGNMDFWNNNIFGFGHVVKNTVYWNTNQQTPLGYYMRYNINNLASTFMDLNLEYIDRFGTKGYKVNLSRPFFSPETKYAGGISYEDMQRYHNFWTFDTTYTDAFTDYYRFDNWVARSVKLDHSTSLSKYRSSIVLSGRWFRDFYHETPGFVHETAFRKLQTRNLYLASIAFIRQNFLKTSFIYSFGRTEDLPFGYNITLTAGLESSVYNKKPYMAVKTSGGKYHYSLGYLYGKAEAGTFIHENKFEQSVLRLEGLYFTHLYGKNKFHYRIFKRFNYTKGIALFPNEYLSIERNHGIAGLQSEQLRGTEKLTTSLETVLFTPWKPLNFRIALFGFTDWGIINNRHKSLFDNKAYQNIGAGVRFRNENLVFNTIELRFTYFFNTTSNMDAQYFQFLGEPRLRPDAFYSRKPAIIGL